MLLLGSAKVLFSQLRAHPNNEVMYLVSDKKGPLGVVCSITHTEAAGLRMHMHMAINHQHHSHVQGGSSPDMPLLPGGKPCFCFIICCIEHYS